MDKNTTNYNSTRLACCFLTILLEIIIPNSYNKSIGTATTNWLKISAGVNIAAKINIITKEYFLFSFKNSGVTMPNLVKK